MQDRQLHRQDVQRFLQGHFSSGHWELRLPRGTGNETYFARCKEQDLFVKLGVQAVRYQTAASLGITPAVLASGTLGDGTTIIVQPHVRGRMPSRGDYRERFGQFASIIQRLHHSTEMKQLLPKVPFDSCRDAGLDVLDHIQGKWQIHRAQVPDVAGFVDESLDSLRRQVMEFKGSGLVASHNDICKGNWLLGEDGSLYLIDLDSMSLDDPALDIGATLWWYLPPELRGEFLREAGYDGEPEFKRRMQVRMAMHCLNIALPRPGSYDQFEPASFAGWLTDFRAAFAGEENPQGYEEV